MDEKTKRLHEENLATTPTIRTNLADPDNPPEPELRTIETERYDPDTLAAVHITIEYWSHAPGHNFQEATATYHIHDGVAECWDIQGDGAVAEQMQAVIAADETVTELDSVDEVKTLEQTRGTAMQHIAKAEEGDDGE
jgi:hypothetical protein